MFKPTVDAASDAASILFNLPEYRVVAVTRTLDGGREVFIDTPALEAGYPAHPKRGCSNRWRVGGWVGVEAFR